MATKAQKAKDAEEQELRKKGKFIRVAALSHGPQVKVLFRGAYGKELAYLMSKETYRAIPYGVTAIVSDYRKFGKVVKAKNTDIFSGR